MILIPAHGLFSPRESKVTLEGGEVLNLTDFQVIDEAAFNTLSDEAFSTSGSQMRSACSIATSPRPTAGPRWRTVRKGERAKSA
ncbi:SapC family protein [Mesorhizobium sp. B2-3-11]|uniref:SapC family protein n=1 Tax=Mesorhizobium sp. B2-3-11 TaxID=2589953 RepID=UPI001FEE09AA|nr:SapC family protein [Mesorhizobium sp. B2-3-11]